MKKNNVSKVAMKEKFADLVIRSTHIGGNCTSWILYQPKRPKVLQHKSESSK